MCLNKKDEPGNSFIIKGFRTIAVILLRYFHNVSADMSSGLLQVFVELRDLHRTYGMKLK